MLDKVEESIVAQADTITALSEERDRLDAALQVNPKITKYKATKIRVAPRQNLFRLSPFPCTGLMLQFEASPKPELL